MHIKLICLYKLKSIRLFPPKLYWTIKLKKRCKALNEPSLSFAGSTHSSTQMLSNSVSDAFPSCVIWPSLSIPSLEDTEGNAHRGNAKRRAPPVSNQPHWESAEESPEVCGPKRWNAPHVMCALCQPTLCTSFHKVMHKATNCERIELRKRLSAAELL